ncbi:uncharacterized protein LOC118191631, partial [Stegodyphus dumicola]|uniref:uncharacterized protein LOC118191631 n=1 Tax=Stegodyphus dumicola TaxID=202533 RepID=UPI0015B2FEEE
MACLQSCIYLILLLCFMENFPKVRSESEPDESYKRLYDCAFKQICECEDSYQQTYAECFLGLKPKLQDMIIDDANKDCNLGSEVTQFSDLTTALCSLPKNVTLPCLYSIGTSFRNRQKSLFEESNDAGESNSSETTSKAKENRELSFNTVYFQ